jgi:hypothetical protein
MKHIQTFGSFLNESKDEIIFSIDDDKLDQMLNARFSRQLDYADDKGDSYYILPKKDFDSFIDLADSSGFDVDYENSEDSVVDVRESVVNEAKTDDYFDYYIANKDTEVKKANNTKKVSVPSGTVISAHGGGYWKSVDGKIETGIESLKGNDDFDVVNNSIWPDTVDLTNEIEAWGRGTDELIQKDPKNVQKIIDARAKVIADIKKMLK